MQQLPVLFRAERAGQFRGDVTAVFPTLPAGPGEMTCYAHIGQHSGCSFGWYHGTRPATPAEYKDLLAELRSIYEDNGGGDGEQCTLKIVARITRAMRDECAGNERLNRTDRAPHVAPRNDLAHAHISDRDMMAKAVKIADKRGGRHDI